MPGTGSGRLSTSSPGGRGIVDRGFTAPGWDPFGYAGLAPDERGVSGGGAARYTDDWQAGRQAGLAESVGRGG